ncbi:MAG: TolC family protein [Methylophilaceae bacterium]|nr:TolC family protein [Methylophilaceae bacterium]
MKYLTLLLLLPACLSHAADYPDLPPTSQVERALRTHPRVIAAFAGLRAGEAHHERLKAGPYEFALRVTGQQRRDRSLDQSYYEHEVGVERSIRLPGKAALDNEIGRVMTSQASHALGDALHESARELLAGWFKWLRADAEMRDWLRQVEILQTQLAVVQKKVAVGESAKLELLLAEAQLAQAEASLTQAKQRRDLAAIELRQYFPAIVLPEGVAPSLPENIAEGADALTHWQQRMLAENHELAMARAAAQQRRLEAARLEADRVPDPTLGLTLGSERDGQEHVVGLHLTIPLPGAARTASARAGDAEAEAAAAREAQVLARIEAASRQTIEAVASSYRQWQRLADVAQRMEENVRLIEKAWRLGEGQFSELQMARRQAIEARLAATQAQLDANEARYRLLIDAHELWDFSEQP